MCVICQYNNGTLSWDELNAMTEINSNWCQGLSVIPAIPNLVNLNCSFSSITSIPQLNSLRVLTCFHCEELTSIPQLNSLQTLYCVECEYLISISPLNSLIELNCSGCYRLKSIPQMDSLRGL